jgi:DNA-binding MarR family transcriptional regulator
MDIISHYQPMSAGKLAVYCGLTTGAITGIVDRLERAGFVCRKNDPEDRRRVLLKPIEDTEKSEKIRKLYQPMSDAFAELAAECSPEQLQFLVDIHTKMNEMTEKIIANLHKG